MAPPTKTVPPWRKLEVLDASVACLSFDPSGVLVHMNGRAAALLGAPADDGSFIGQAIESLAAPGWAVRLRDAFESDGASLDASLRTTDDRRSVRIGLTLAPVLDEQGRRLGVICLLAPSLDAVEPRLGKIAAHLSGVIYEVRVTRTGDVLIEFVSDKIVEYTGVAAKELMARGASVLELVHPEDRAAVMQAALAALRDEAPVSVSLRVVHGDQVYEMFTTATVDRLPSGEVRASGVALDVGPNRRTEKDLRASRALLNAVFENFPFEVWALDGMGRFALQNPRSRARLGTCVGKSLDETELPAGVVEDWIHDNQRALVGEVVRRDGLVRESEHPGFYSRISAPILDGERVIGVVGVSIDTTDQKRLEEQLLQAQKLDAIGRLAGGVAHDFNNVLTAIISSVRLLERRLEGPPRKELRIIRDGAQRAADLTKQLLTFARQGRVEPRLTSLNELVLRTDRLLRRLIGEDIELVTLTQDLDLRIVIDPVRLEQAIIHLVVNSRHAMPKGGKITVQASETTLANEEQCVDGRIPPGQYAVISVEDNGMGMAPEIIERAFEPFFTTRLDAGGTGLGLSSVYGSVRQAGGYILLDSELGRGTKISLLLPGASSLPEVVEQPAKVAPEPVRGTETILLVEDEPLVMTVTMQFLRNSGYQVLTARSPEEALKASRDHQGKIDLLLSDVVLPLGSGPDLAETLRREREGLAVLFISGYTADRINLRRAEENFLAKPFTPDELAQSIRDALEGGV